MGNADNKDVKDIKTGTTTLGIRTPDSVVMAADMRASMGHIAYDEESEKVYRITDYLALANAGNVGDSLTIIRFLRAQAKLYEIERETRMSAKAAATFLSNILNGNRYFPFIVQSIIGGFNEKPEIYEVSPFGGILGRKKYAANGSGTEMALGTLDNFYREDMTEQEAIELSVRAIEAGKRRDIYSGGISVKVAVVDSRGIRFLSEEQVKAVSPKKNNDKGRVKK
jgi:proteasome beta subunit